MEILQRALREALDRNAAETVRWRKYKEQHEEAKVSIEEFRKSLEVDIMVPIGSKALMPGRLYHTNEIVVSHSGTYYSKCTAHKALEICQNRLNVAESRLKALEVEADLHRNQLDLPLDFDAFSSQEIIETYDEEEEQTWQVNHKMKVKEQKRKEAIERQQLMNGKAEDDIIKRLEELELMEELENELEAISEEDVEAVQAMLSERPEPISCKNRISRVNENAAPSIENASSAENDSVSSDSTDDDDGDDDDIPVELKELELKALKASMTKRDKVKLFQTKLDEVQKYLENLRPRTLEEISHKTDMMFLSDHLINAIEMMEDELKCDQYLNEENVITEDKDNDVSTPSPTSVPQQTILKKKQKISFARNDDNGTMESREEPSKVITKKIRFANEDHVKSFDVLEEPSKISSTVIYDHGPVLNLNVNHSEAVFKETDEQSDVIRSPVDIYKQFAGSTRNETKKEAKGRVVQTEFKDRPTSQPIIHTPVERPSPKKIKEEPRDKDVVVAKTEVKNMLDNMFGTKNTDEPDPLPDGNFVDSHQPKKRVSLFKQRRQMKSQ